MTLKVQNLEFVVGLFNCESVVEPTILDRHCITIELVYVSVFCTMLKLFGRADESVSV